MVFLHVNLPAVVALKLLSTCLTFIARGELWMSRLNVLSHVVHVPSPLAAHQAEVARAFRGSLTVGLQVPIWIWEGSLQSVRRHSKNIFNIISTQHNFFYVLHWHKATEVGKRKSRDCSWNVY